ncbi:MAG: hypothetical protein WCV67_09450 [Victivallaceae bacterium]
MKRTEFIICPILLTFLLFLTTAALAQGEAMRLKRSASEAVEEAHRALWSKFVDRHGIILDFIGEIPTPQDCATGKPNALGWFCPIENGPMFTGLYLPAACERARRSGASADKDNARKLAQGLLKCASVSDVPGMIVRGMATDGQSHYPLGSDDQTHPWFLGLHAYWKSGIPSAAEKAEIVRKVKEVADVLDKNGWKCPCDGSFKGQFRGGFKGELFRDAARYLFMLKAVHEMTGDPVWLERYTRAQTERPGKRGLTRLEICAAGYGPDIEFLKWNRRAWPHWNWIFVGSQASLRQLAGMETDATIKAQFQAGLAAGAREALTGIAECVKFDNNDTKTFGSANWRQVYSKWVPQKTQAEAMKLSESGDNKKKGERDGYEHQFMNAPLAAAAIVALAGDPARRDAVERAICHYDYQKIYGSRFFFAECAYYAFPQD